MNEFDVLDKQLLSALREDGRAPVSQLARQLGITRATVTSRIDRMVRSGIIVGFSVRLRDDSDAGMIRAISFIAVEGQGVDRVIHALRGFPEIHALHTTNGEWDVVAEIRAPTLTMFDRVLGRIRAVPGIVSSETSLLLSSVVR